MLETAQERIELLKAGIPASVIEDLYILHNSYIEDEEKANFLKCSLVEVEIPL